MTKKKPIRPRTKRSKVEKPLTPAQKRQATIRQRNEEFKKLRAANKKIVREKEEGSATTTPKKTKREKQLEKELRETRKKLKEFVKDAEILTEIRRFIDWKNEFTRKEIDAAKRRGVTAMRNMMYYIANTHRVEAREVYCWYYGSPV